MPAHEHDDQLDRLRAARPHVDATATSPEHPAAQALLHDIVASKATPVIETRSSAPRARATYRRPSRIAAMVAGVTVVAVGAGFVTTRGGSGDTPGTPIAASATTTAPAVRLVNIRTVAARSNAALGATGRAEITFSGGDGVQSGTTDLSFAGGNVAMTIHFAGAQGEPGFDTTNKTVDGEFYLYTPGPDNVTRWYHDTNSSGSSVFDSDPRTLLASLVPQAGFVEVGNGTVDNVAVTHLRATTLGTLPALNLSLGPVDAHSAKSLDLWVDGNDVVRRLDLVTEEKVQEIDASVAPLLEKHTDGTITIHSKDGHDTQTVQGRDLTDALKDLPHVTRTFDSNYSVRFFDIGAPIIINAPAGAVDIAAKG